MLQVDAPGDVLSAAEERTLIGVVEDADVPVAVWVGEASASRAYGAAFAVAEAADVVGAVPRSRLGPDDDRSLAADAAAKDGRVDLVTPTLGDFIVGVDGRDVAGTELETATVVERDGEQRREPAAVVRFSKLGLVARLLHTVASPSVGYLLLLLGLLLIVFEFFTAGVGVAGATGAGALVLGAIGLATLPARPWAVALLVIGVAGYTIDVQAGAPRFWTAVGTICLAVGSVRLYDGLSVPLLTLAVAVGGVALFMVAAMPSMIRTRFATPTIGRESMIGELGTALTGVSPEGTVTVRDAPWRARTNRATPIKEGEAIRVVGIDGLLLEVEPEAGGARDYRKH